MTGPLPGFCVIKTEAGPVYLVTDICASVGYSRAGGIY